MFLDADISKNNSNSKLPLEKTEIKSSKMTVNETLFALPENDFPTSIAREVKIIAQRPLDESQQSEKLSLIANKILSLEAQQKG
jgi:hypothetical protein